ncbi:hypothetical protein [Alteromonas lipotrueiana]|nr:hypothetical protein [Alteromonas lipotrueiana]
MLTFFVRSVACVAPGYVQIRVGAAKLVMGALVIFGYDTSFILADVPGA